MSREKGNYHKTPMPLPHGVFGAISSRGNWHFVVCGLEAARQCFSTAPTGGVSLSPKGVKLHLCAG